MKRTKKRSKRSTISKRTKQVNKKGSHKKEIVDPRFCPNNLKRNLSFTRVLCDRLCERGW